jgi:HlyD family secretion protein
MSLPKVYRGRRLRRWLPLAALAAGLVAAIAGYRAWNRPPKPTLDGLATATVRRVDFGSTILAGGRTESASNTVVECQLERLEMRNEGRSSMVGGSSVIIWVIEDGSTVKKGDVLCRLDASDYEELVRQQEIKVERARADLRTTELDHQVAVMSVTEFKDGLMAQSTQEMEVALSLAESEVSTGKNRLEWLRRMQKKGYASVAQITSGEVTVKGAENEVRKATWALDNFRKFGAPKEIRTLEAQVESTRADLLYCQARATRFDERLAYYKEMVDLCTIRAPHDGFVIYVPARFWSNDAPIEAGQRVRQGQDLFYLPDLAKMRVAALIHESLVTRIHPGQTVRSKIEGLGGRTIEGHVLSVDPLPDPMSGWFNEVKSFKATIALDSSPRGLRPEMTAEAEIEVGRRSNVLSVPVEAVAFEGGKDYCYVSVDGVLERRRVTLGESNSSLLEVTDGLEEGEEVALAPTHLEPYATLIVEAPADERPAAGEAARAGATEKVGL